MSKNNHRWVQRLVLCVPLFLLGSGLLVSCLKTKAADRMTQEKASSSASTSPQEDEGKEKGNKSSSSPPKVLYVTHEPGKYHKYTPQKKIFQEIAKKHEWDLEIITGGHDEVADRLASEPDFAKGFDVVVYNICMAHSKKVKVPYHIMRQTKVHQVPTFLIHCSLHSFWPTFRAGKENKASLDGYPDKVKVNQELLDHWQKMHPEESFPVWSDFTGIASSRHGPRHPIQTKQLDKDHPCFTGVPEYLTGKGELYNNYLNAEDSPSTKPLLKGIQEIPGKSKASESIVLWEHPYEGSTVIAFTLGHGKEEWDQVEFQTIISNTVHYLSSLK